MKNRITLCLTLLTLLFINSFTLHAQEVAERNPVNIGCGDIVDGEFLTSHERHSYIINMNPGDKIQASITPIGQLLDTAIYIYSPASEMVIAISDSDGSLRDGKYYTLRTENNPKIDSGVLSARGNYFISINNYDWTGYVATSGGVGVYTLSIGCTLRDGTVIDAGSINTNTTPQNLLPNTPTFSGTGFPGLTPVDFVNAANLPLPAGIAMSGGITPNGGEILGYLLDANANDILDLTFTRLSGNLNLGLVVLSADNQVVFQASLITSTTLNTRFTLPSAGQYTIGVFRIDLLPPTTPEATAFQIQGTLNP